MYAQVNDMVTRGRPTNQCNPSLTLNGTRDEFVLILRAFINLNLLSSHLCHIAK
jgi:hypothetical protein